MLLFAPRHLRRTARAQLRFRWSRQAVCAAAQTVADSCSTFRVLSLEGVAFIRMSRVERTSRFVVVDSAGLHQVMIEYTEYVDTGEERKRYKLWNAQVCKLRDDGTFEVVDTGAILRRPRRSSARGL